MVAFRDRINHLKQAVGLKASTDSAKKQRPNRVSGFITPQATRRAQQDINGWQTALRKAEHVTVPRRNLLINLYDNLMLDGHLNGQTMIRRSRAIGGGFSVFDKSGEANPELTALLQKPWFYDLMAHFWNACLYGHSLVEIEEYEPLKGDTGGIKKVKLVNRKHVVPEQGLVLKNETDASGIAYREDASYSYLFETSNHTALGLLNICAAPVLYKRYAFASMSEFAEIYGIPPRVGKTDISDSKLVKQMSEELQQMGRSAVAVIDMEDSIDFLEIKGTQTGDIFKNVINEANAEVSKTINGTVIGEATQGGSRSKEEVGERTTHLVTRDDRKDLELEINNQVIPKLILLGYPLENCTWALDDDIDIDGLFDKVDKLLKTGDVDAYWIQDKFGIPYTPKQAAAPDPKKEMGFFE